MKCCFINCALTFERGVQHLLFDLGFLYHIGSCLGEDELSWPWLETIPVVLNYRHAILHAEYNTSLVWCCVSTRCVMTFYYLDVLIANHLYDPHVYVLFT